jgi:hypothetical protein
VLKVVEQQQHVPLAQVVEQMGGGVRLPGKSEIESIANCHDYLVWSIDGSKGNESDTVAETITLPPGNLKCQARFTDPTRTNHGQQAASWIVPESGYGG